MRFSVIVLSFLLFFPHAALAQSGDAVPVAPCVFAAASQVAVVLTSDLEQTVPDSPVGIEATITNTGAAPLYDGVLFVRVLDESAAPAIIVDEFVAARDIDIAAHATASTTFEWRVPLRAMSGAYRLQGFYMYAGAPFVPLDPSKKDGNLSLAVASGARNQLLIDTGQIMVGGKPYSPERAFVLDATTSIPISIVFKNPTDGPFMGIVTWSVYERGYSALSNPSAVRRDALRIHSGMTATDTYTIEDATAAAYYVEAEFSGGGTLSRVGMFLTRDAHCAMSTIFAPPPPGPLSASGVALVVLIILGGLAWELWKKRF